MTLTNLMTHALDLMCKGDRLIQIFGGYWTPNGIREFYGPGMTRRWVSTNTIKRLLNAGLIVTVEDARGRAVEMANVGSPKCITETQCR